LILRKIIQIVAIRCHILRLKCIKFDRRQKEEDKREGEKREKGERKGKGESWVKKEGSRENEGKRKKKSRREEERRGCDGGEKEGRRKSETPRFY